MSTPEENDAAAVAKAEVEQTVRPSDTDEAASEAPTSSAPSSSAGTKPSAKEVNRTIQLDVAQIDLVDVPLPPSSEPKEDSPRVSKGPPPLPPPLPPSVEPSAPVAQQGAQISARQLLEGGSPNSTNPAARFALGLGTATFICVGLWFGLKTLRKPHATPVISTSAAPPVASAPAPTPMRTIIIAPIEMTGPALGASESASATSAPTAKPPSSGTATVHPANTASARATPSGASSKPRSGDDVIKVEN